MAAPTPRTSCCQYCNAPLVHAMDQAREWVCGYAAGMTTRKSKVIPRSCLEYKLTAAQTRIKELKAEKNMEHDACNNYLHILDHTKTELQAANTRAEEYRGIARELALILEHDHDKHEFPSCSLCIALQRLEKAEAQQGWKIPKAGSVTTPTSGHIKLNATTIP